MPSAAEIRREILERVDARGAGKTICPSEVARALVEDWRMLMPRVQQQICELARHGSIVVTQGGERIDPETARGPIRLGKVADAD